MLLGSSGSHKGNELYDLEAREVSISKHVTFKENIFPFKSVSSNSESESYPIPISVLESIFESIIETLPFVSKSSVNNNTSK